MNAWTQLQNDGIDKAREALTRRQSICLVAPTGFGKTRISSQIALGAQAKSAPWAFFTHRKFLFEQTAKTFQAAGLSIGCVASDWEHWEDPAALGQICMLPTIYARSTELPPARLVFVDELHANTGDKAKAVIDHYREQGARIIGLSATPVDLKQTVQELVIVATNSQAREVGAILPAKLYAPDEVSMREISKKLSFSQVDVSNAMRPYLHQVVGSVYEHWRKLNPYQLPAVCFAPGVAESMWIVDEFTRRGVCAAHIDGEKVYLGEKDAGVEVVYDGKAKPSVKFNLIFNQKISTLSGDEATEFREALRTGTMRDLVRLGSRHGIFKVVSNRFVLREGVDWPWLYHAIFATSFSDVKNWLQSVGRVLRFWAEYDHVLVQDHGANCVRAGLGDPNADRDWKLGDTSKSIRKEGEKAFQGKNGDKPEEQVKVCPKCKCVVIPMQWRRNNGACPACHFKFTHSVRMIWESDGELKPTRGNAYKVKAAQSSNAQKAWDSIYYPSSKSQKKHSSTYRQCVARFHKDFPQFRIEVRNGIVGVKQPDGTFARLKRVPPPESDAWNRKVRAVQYEELQV